MNAAPTPSWKSPGDAAPDAEARALILPGGKVDPDAVRMAIGDAEDIDPSADDSESEGLCRVSFRLSRDLNKRLDKYLTDRITFMSRNQLQRLIDLGAVTVNGRAPKASTKLRLNDVVEVAIPPPPSTEIQPQAIPLDILYEDDHFIIVNKQPDLIVHPARSHHSGTLLNALVHHFQQAPVEGQGLSRVGHESARPGVVHRLDRHTSGVMVVAKDDEAHWKLGRQFERRVVDKRYLAIVQGVIEADADVLDAPIGPHHSKVKGQREKMIVRHDPMGKTAVTIYRVRQRFHPPHDASSAGVPVRGFTLVELELKTGRTHQIRVHMSHMGYPLVGDDMYGGRHTPLAELAPDDSTVASAVFARQALHATVLGFQHPITSVPMIFSAPVPPDMAQLLSVLRRHWRASEVLDVPGSTIDLSVVAP